MNDIIIHKINEVFFQLECEDSTAIELSNFLKCFAPNYKYHPRFKLHIWDGRVTFFDSRTRLLPIGLYPYISKFCKKNNYTYSFEFDSKKFRNNLTDEFLEKFYLEIFSGTKFTLRDYQKELIEVALKNKRGILLSATSSGKSITIYAMIRFFLMQNKRVILIVPNIQLVNQMYSDFAEYSQRNTNGDYPWKDVDNYVAKLYNGMDPDLNKPVLISTFQSLAKKDLNFFETCGAVIVDETHRTKTVSIKNILKNCINADYRIGVTGTMTSDLCELYTITGYLGPILKEIKVKELQEQGFLADIKIKNIVLKYPIEFIKDNRRLEYDDEKKAIYNNPDRNKILNLIFSNIPDEQNTLILLENLWHLDFVKEHIEKTFSEKYELLVIHGKIDPEDREAFRQIMESKKNIILLATYGTLSTGVSIKNIKNIVFFASSRGQIRVLQSIGRGLRMKEGKTFVTLWDVVDSLCYKTKSGNLVRNHLFKHWEGDKDRDKLGRLDYYNAQKFEYKTLEKNICDLI